MDVALQWYRLRDVCATLESLANGRHQVSHDICLSNVTGGPSGKCSGNEVPVFMYRQKYDLGSAVFGLQALGCLQSVQNRHGYINYQHVRIETFCFCDSVPPIIYGANDVKVLAQ